MALEQGLKTLSLDLSAPDRTRLLDYLALLVRWNSVYNLTAVRDPDAMLVQHLLDSLAVVAPLKRALDAVSTTAGNVTALDIGSGAGLPAIPMAIAWPALNITTVEPVGKKSAFIQQAIATLRLDNAAAYHGRVETFAQRPLPQAPAALIVSRAFASLADFVAPLGPLAGPDTCVAAMKGQRPQDEIAALPHDWRVTDLIELKVPQLQAQRHLVLLQRT